LFKKPFNGFADCRFSSRPAPFGKKQPTKSFLKLVNNKNIKKNQRQEPFFILKMMAS
jgi:hypothetical protein